MLLHRFSPMSELRVLPLLTAALLRLLFALRLLPLAAFNVRQNGLPQLAELTLRLSGHLVHRLAKCRARSGPRVR